MYHSLKRIAKRIFPKKLLENNEGFFRHIISLRYKGNSHQCNICGMTLRYFVTLNNHDLLCPKCGSRSRTRQLYQLLNATKLLKGNVLHFSPPRVLYEKFKSLNDLKYFGSDFENQFVSDYNFDITHIAVEANFFDVIICYHILEHIENDTLAMAELYRVLKPNGLCLIQTPYKDGAIYEDNSVKLPKARKIAFGQEDHVRMYSIEGLEQRLNSCGFETQIKQLHQDDFYGLIEEHTIIAKKSD